MSEARLRRAIEKGAGSIVRTLWAIAFAVFVFYACAHHRGANSTDRVAEGDTTKSGLWLRIDAKTGCHYLESSNGDLVPRVRKDGTHICTGFPDTQSAQPTP